MTKTLLYQAPLCFGRHVEPLVPALFVVVSTHWALVVGYGPFSLCIIHKESMYSSSGDIDRLMIITRICCPCFLKLVIPILNRKAFWVVYNDLIRSCNQHSLFQRSDQVQLVFLKKSFNLFVSLYQ
jgi:hypothetical protein